MDQPALADPARPVDVGDEERQRVGGQGVLDQAELSPASDKGAGRFTP
jgi:hypothetical protein